MNKRESQAFQINARLLSDKNKSALINATAKLERNMTKNVYNENNIDNFANDFEDMLTYYQ